MAGLNRLTGKMLDGWDHVAQSIGVLVTTRLKTRVMRRDVGSALREKVDSPISAATIIDFYAATAGVIDKWEPRFRITKVTMGQPEDGHLTINAEGVYFPRGHLGDFSVQVPKNVSVSL